MAGLNAQQESNFPLETILHFWTFCSAFIFALWEAKLCQKPFERWNKTIYWVWARSELFLNWAHVKTKPLYFYHLAKFETCFKSHDCFYSSSIELDLRRSHDLMFWEVALRLREFWLRSCCSSQMLHISSGFSWMEKPENQAIYECSVSVHSESNKY